MKLRLSIVFIIVLICQILSADDVTTEESFSSIGGEQSTSRLYSETIVRFSEKILLGTWLMKAVFFQHVFMEEISISETSLFSAYEFREGGHGVSNPDSEEEHPIIWSLDRNMLRIISETTRADYMLNMIDQDTILFVVQGSTSKYAAFVGTFQRYTH